MIRSTTLAFQGVLHSAWSHPVPLTKQCRITLGRCQVMWVVEWGLQRVHRQETSRGSPGSMWTAVLHTTPSCQAHVSHHITSHHITSHHLYCTIHISKGWRVIKLTCQRARKQRWGDWHQCECHLHSWEIVPQISPTCEPVLLWVKKTEEW